ncbi:MAG: hypothetical protein WCI73_03110 [Phycisphaerae bacterium]
MSDDFDMESAALLPESDPLRRCWAEKIRQSPPEQQAQWRKLTLETADLQRDLLAVPTRTGLETRLLAARAATTRSRWSVSSPMRWLAVAAALLLMVTLGRYTWVAYESEQDRRNLESLAQLAIQEPVPPGMLVESADARVVEKVLAAQRLDMPPVVMDFRLRGTNLLGGGVTTLNGQRISFTRWQRGTTRFTLYQFPPAPYRLRDNFAARDQVVATPGTVTGGFHIWFWSEPENHCGWALIADSPTAENPFAWG